MRVLVTGASGFVGRALLARLRGAGIPVRAVSRAPVPVSEPGHIEWQRVQHVTDRQSWRDAVSGCDTVVHLAALAHQTSHRARGRGHEFREANVAQTRLLSQVCRDAGVSRLVFVSSVAAIGGEDGAVINEGTPARPRDDYGRSKLEAERALCAELDGSRVDWCTLRPPLLYGPENPGNMARLVALIHSGWPLPFAAIENRRTFMFVDNLADALRAVVEFPDTIRRAFFVADDSDFSTPGLVQALADATGHTVRQLWIPPHLLRAAGWAGDLIGLLGLHSGIDSYSIDRLLGSLLVDASEFRAAFGWRPPFTVVQALQLTCRGAPVGGKVA